MPFGGAGSVHFGDITVARSGPPNADVATGATARAGALLATGLGGVSRIGALAGGGGAGLAAAVWAGAGAAAVTGGAGLEMSTISTSPSR
jgi:hypothetical protein